MRTRRNILLVMVLLAAAPALAGAAEWSIDPSHSVARFTARHLMISNVTGQLGKVGGVVIWDPADPARSTVEATIDTTGLDSHQPDRDKHLKSPDFLDVEKFPVITFKSTKVEKSAEGRLKVTGDLTIKGVTKQVVLDVEGPSAPVSAFGAMKSGVSATTKINRQDFGVSWSKSLDGGGLVVSDEVAIQIEIEMTQKK